MNSAIEAGLDRILFEGKKKVMKNKVILFTVAIVYGFSMREFTPTENPEICDLKGLVYIERVASFADYRIYQAGEDAWADLIVYQSPVRPDSFQKGEWFLTTSRAEADFTVYLEKQPEFADWTLAYTPFLSNAGCP